MKQVFDWAVGDQLVKDICDRVFKMCQNIY